MSIFHKFYQNLGFADFLAPFGMNVTSPVWPSSTNYRQLWEKSVAMPAADPRGAIKFGFGRNVPPRNLKLTRPIQILIFQEKVTYSYTDRPNFGPNFEQNHPIFSKFSLIWPNFENFSHSYTKFCVLWGVIHIPWGWFRYPCWWHVPV